MTPRRKRLVGAVAALSVLGAGAWLVLSAFEKNMVFFLTPTQVAAGDAPQGRLFRLGGMVERGSLQRGADGLRVAFVVTDLHQRIAVRYTGLLPDLFKEGKGVVTQGRLVSGGVFEAEEVLAKHDENYMPPEAAYALQQGASRAAARQGAQP
ncbi:cytochrome c maturation protein CcmE [Aquabacterium sp.]|uniref:cytochrome c maturation protein CcmE n=1 Tax=Aquabacterium sp. TaxID=1872578 RepID=UPI0035AF9447